MLLRKSLHYSNTDLKLKDEAWSQVVLEQGAQSFQQLRPMLTRSGAAQSHLLKAFTCSGTRDFPRWQILCTAVQPKIPSRFSPSSYFFIFWRASCSFALSKAVFKCLFAIEEGDTLGGCKLCLKSQISDRWVKSSSSVHKNTCIFTYLALPFGKYH